MTIENWSEDVVLVELTAGNADSVRDEMKAVMQKVRERGNCDVVMDFTHVDILNSGHLAELLRLNKLLADCQRRLLLCSVSQMIRGIFTVTGLEDAFEIVADRFDALATVGGQTCK